MQKTADVVVIGAGVIGCSTAYHLAQLGIRNVAVVEMGEVGSGSSSKSASMLSLQFFHDELALRMAKYSYRKYQQFELEFGNPIDFKKIGWLSLATAESAEHLGRTAKLLTEMNVPTEVLEPGEIRRRYPEINTEDLVLGTFGPDDGPFDAHMIMWGYIQKAKEMGVKLYQGVRATGIKTQNEQVEGVDTDHGFLITRAVVNAGGPWAVEIGRWVGVEIPIINLARCIWVTSPFPDLPPNRPFVEDLTAGWYYRPEGAGILMGMGTEPTQTFDIEISHSLLDKMTDVAIHRVPLFGKVSILTSWTGIRPTTADERPIIGPVPSVKGFFLNCGWGGTGIIQAPIAGKLIAEFIRVGKTTIFDSSLLSLERFQGKTC